MAFPDDDPESKFAPDDPDLLKNRSIPQRAIVISAGVIANVIFAFSLLFTQVSRHTCQQAAPCHSHCEMDRAPCSHTYTSVHFILNLLPSDSC